MIARVINESCRPDNEVREIVDFVYAQIPGRIEHGGIVVKVVDGKGGGRASYGQNPKWAGRFSYAVYVTIPLEGSKHDCYGLPRVCWHSDQARKAVRGAPNYDDALLVTYETWAAMYDAGERRYGRWPIYAVRDWREHLVHVLAHEINHVIAWDSRRTRGRGSEIQCELFAERALNSWRARLTNATGTGIVSVPTKEEQMSATAELDATLHKQARAARTNTKTATKAATRKRAGKRAPVSTLKAAEIVLGRAKGPLHVKEITARILAMPDTGLKGKTPEASVGAILAVNAKKPGTVFKRTEPSTYTLKNKR